MLPFKTQWKRGAETLSRRELFRRSALLTMPALFRGTTAAAATPDAAPDGLRVGQDIYQLVRPTYSLVKNILIIPFELPVVKKVHGGIGMQLLE